MGVRYWPWSVLVSAFLYYREENPGLMKGTGQEEGRIIRAEANAIYVRYLEMGGGRQGTVT